MNHYQTNARRKVSIAERNIFKRGRSTTVEDLMIDPAGNAENELRRLFARPARHIQPTGIDAMSARVIAASKPVTYKGFARTPGWLDKRSA